VRPSVVSHAVECVTGSVTVMVGLGGTVPVADVITASICFLGG